MELPGAQTATMHVDRLPWQGLATAQHIGIYRYSFWSSQGPKRPKRTSIDYPGRAWPQHSISEPIGAHSGAPRPDGQNARRGITPAGPGHSSAYRDLSVLIWEPPGPQTAKMHVNRLPWQGLATAQHIVIYRYSFWSPQGPKRPKCTSIDYPGRAWRQHSI